MSKTLSAPREAAAAVLAARIRITLSRLNRHLREQGWRSDLTPSQMSVILRLEEEKRATISALARGEGITPQSMGTIVASLRHSGLLSSAPDPSDGRKTLQSLSDRCVKLLHDIRNSRQDWLADVILRKLTAAERKLLSSAVDLLVMITED